MHLESMNLTFPPLNNPELETLLKGCSQRLALSSGYTFFSPKDNGDYVMYIKEGEVRHYMKNSEGNEKILYTLKPGWMFAESSWFLGTHLGGLHCKCAGNTLIYKIPGDTCRRLIDENKIFRDAILKCFANKIIVLRYEIENLSFNSCKSRLKRLFCASADLRNEKDPEWYNLKISYTHYDLGVIVGAARVTVSKLIGELCDEGFIRVINHKLQISRKMYQDCLAEQENDIIIV